MQDRRRLGTSGSHDDTRLRGPGQPGRGWLRSPAGAGWGEPSCPRPKPGCGWKHPRGCGRKQSVYRWGRRRGSGEGPGQCSGSPSSPASQQLDAPLPPVNRKNAGGPRTPRRPARIMTLGGKLPVLRGRGAATAKEAEAERSRVGFSRGADVAPGSLLRGAPGAMTGASGTSASLSAAAHL